MRFGAALAVVLLHYWWAFLGHNAPGPIAFGYLAVGFFFVLSGVVLSWSWEAGTPVTTQWRRRIARIVPLHWLMLAASGLVLLNFRIMAPPGSFTWHAFFAHLSLTQAWPPYHQWFAFDAPSWSLSTEMFFYALFPLVVPLVARLQGRGLAIAAVAGVLAYFAGQYFIPMLHNPVYRLGGLLIFPPLQFLKFFVGVCIGCALRKGWRPKIKIWQASGVLAALLLGLGTLTNLPAEVNIGLHVTLVDCLAFVPIIALVIAGASRDLRTERPRRSRTLVRLGEESFGLYLVHWVVLQAVFGYRFHTGGSWNPPLGPAWMVFYIVVCVLLAKVLHFVYERPLERLIRGRRRVAPAVPAAAFAVTGA